MNNSFGQTMKDSENLKIDQWRLSSLRIRMIKMKNEQNLKNSWNTIKCANILIIRSQKEVRE